MAEEYSDYDIFGEPEENICDIITKIYIFCDAIDSRFVAPRIASEEIFRLTNKLAERIGKFENKQVCENFRFCKENGIRQYRPR